MNKEVGIADIGPITIRTEVASYHIEVKIAYVEVVTAHKKDEIAHIEDATSHIEDITLLIEAVISHAAPQQPTWCLQKPHVSCNSLYRGYESS